MKALIFILAFLFASNSFGQAVLYSNDASKLIIKAKMNKTRDSILLKSDYVIDQVTCWQFGDGASSKTRSYNEKEVKFGIGHLPLGTYLIKVSSDKLMYLFTLLKADPIED